MKSLMIVMILGLSVVPVKAQVNSTGSMITSGDMETDCKLAVSADPAERASYLGGVCDGYTAGFLSSVWFGFDTVVVEGKAYTWKVEDHVTVGQVEKVFVKYMSEHPELDNKQVSVGFTDALIDAKLISVAEVKPTATSPVPKSRGKKA